MSKKKKSEKRKSDTKKKKVLKHVSPLKSKTLKAKLLKPKPLKKSVKKALKAPSSLREKVVSKSFNKKDLPLKIKEKNNVKKKDKLREKSRDASSGKSTAKVIVRKSAPTPVRVVPIKISKEMLEIRSRLQTMLGEMRRDIDHEVRGASERDLAHINDTSDMASDAAEGDLALRIAESETVEAEEIERAIEKIDNGTYGICEMCNKPIGADRLKFLPYVTLCIKCQELSEIRRREDGDELDDLAEGAETDNDA